jgi:hypothetical protein
MKNGKCIILILALLLAMSISTITFSEDNLTQTIKVTLNEEYLEFDVEPITLENRTLVPIQAIFEALDLDVGWDGNTQTVTGKNDIVNDRSKDSI